MALIFCESFDGVAASTDLVGKWTAITDFAITTGRYGNGIIGGGGSAEMRLALSVAEQDDFLVIGAAIRTTAIVERAIATLRSDINATTHLTWLFNANGQLVLRRGTSSGTVLASSPNNTIQANTWHYVELLVRLSDSTSDVAMQRDGSLLTLTPSGPYDTKNGGTATVFDNVAFGAGGVGVASNPTYDDIVILNEKTIDAFGNTSALVSFLGDCRVEALQPNGNGNSSQLDGSDGNSVDNYLLVDDVTPDDDATYVQSDVNDEKDTYALENLASTSGAVAAIQIVTRARKTDTGSRSLAHVARSGGSELDSSDYALAATYSNQRTVMEKKPSGSAYSIADVNAAEAGAKVRP